MIISVNWLKKYVDIDMPIEELATLIGARLVEIESITSLHDKYRDVVVAKVVTCEPIKDSDHLSLTTIDDGGKVKDVERNEKGHIQVVCGAPNVKEGQTVAWLPPGSVVPETHGSSEPFVLGARKLRGFMSNGMIASAKELDLFDDHTGIVELPLNLRAGESFSKALELDDYLLDIENKSLTHRPDTFGIIGLAREIAGIAGKKFDTPDWLKNTDTPAYSGKTPLTAAIQDSELSDRYGVVVLDDVDVSKQSPLWMQSYLARSNIRPINVVVDILNYTMLLTGQPLHAFDYDKTAKLAGGDVDIAVRGGNGRETLTLLDGKEITLDKTDIVITASDKPIALAGAMGGASTAVDEETKRIIIESATFNLYNLRTTQMRHGIFSEAITRFTKGQPAELSAPVLAETVRLLEEYAGATPASKVIDVYPAKQKQPTISVSLQQVNDLLGTDFDSNEVTAILERVEFDVSIKSPATFLVTPPYWRADIHISEDIIEEVGRLSGFDEISPTLPHRDMRATRPSSFDQFRGTVRKQLVRAGANEVLTYSFIHGDMMKKVGQNDRLAYKIVNSLSPELQYYRQSLTPSLLAHVYSNIRAGFKQFALFEMNKVHTKQEPLTDEKVPAELDSLGFVIT
ncbi:MAG TPA: phenylalanine--tRNA ligase subunit beta, partial [Candidatus Saccharibacteria bacterium]|nr:phenylalanine--tRNA ligase subunit beta [Candidatus Saccharibacteria bacterium]